MEKVFYGNRDNGLPHHREGCGKLKFWAELLYRLRALTRDTIVVMQGKPSEKFSPLENSSVVFLPASSRHFYPQINASETHG